MRSGHSIEPNVAVSQPYSWAYKSISQLLASGYREQSGRHNTLRLYYLVLILLDNN